MTSPAEELRQRGLRLTNQRRYPEARRVLEQAAALSASPDVTARIAGTLAYVLGQMGEAAEGERLVRRALEEPALGAHAFGVVAGQLGSLLWNRGRLDEALEWFGRAIDTIPDDPVAVANLRMNRSVLLMQRGDLAGSAVDLEHAAAAYAAEGSDVEMAEAQHNLGYVSLLGGDLLRAMREMTAARPAIAHASPANAAIGDVDMAEVLRDAGLVTDAERLLQGAALVFGRARMPGARAEAELQLARSLLRHDTTRSGRTARSAARRFAAAGNRLGSARAEAIALRAGFAGGSIDRAGRQVVDPRRRPADADVDRVARALHRGGLRNDAVALRLSRELWRATHAVASGPLPRLPETASLEVRLLAQEVRAARAAARRRDAEARRHAAAGLDELADWRSSFGSLDMQTSLAMHGNGLILAGLGAAVRSGRPDAVFEWSERARHLSLQVVPLRPPPDAEAAADLAELRILRADLAGADWMADPRAIELSDRLRRRQWIATGTADVSERVDLAAFGGGLDEDTALLAYVFSPEGLSCLVVTRAGATLVDLPGWAAARADLAGLRSDLDVSASVRSGPMAEVVRRGLAARLARLSAALLDAPLARSGTTRVVLTVPGVLAGLPWGMLPGLAGRGFTLAGSASRWAGGRTMLQAAPTSAGFAAGPRVARGDEEVGAAASAWTSPRVLDGAHVTVDAVAALGGEVGVLHVAAHGRHAVDNPLFSGLELADGVLFGYDIDRMPRVPDVVVLSACEVGRSAVRWGEEAVGMTRAWLHAGARCVVAAPVVVADDDACELLGALHGGLSAGLSPATALAAAAGRTGILAPFQCHGDGF
ncbi:CHAT domain-containing protein [Microbacterium terricola]|uniref:CHAT domain-containing protein n=1 Tax=Microbacterium terricola TaxID=344163 RepID=A0ABM8DVF0_9MICO|nr:CHAT domain-containing tetratricopeptide repeat protein [Microbacterium terricola]UYK39602.1 CHAT domain-containing tetratricopeptide repeat protein [Microbacterium terricola]BDV29658.1 CHAT domain-containing protein [Microbacterium terricola]